jgi:phthalate 4,5-dioxygenase oxygenase subunit
MDVDGNILEMPTEPELTSFAEKVKAPSYPTQERGGLIWTYMGPPEKKPALPEFEWMVVPSSHRDIIKTICNHNWVQGIEATIDSAHIGVLHLGLAFLPGEDGKASSLPFPSNDNAPRIEAENTDFGFHYAAIRKPIACGDETQYIRVTSFAEPFHVLIPPGVFYINFVPIDDLHTAQYVITWNPAKPLSDQMGLFNQYRREGSGLVVGQTVGEDYRLLANPENGWLQDRSNMPLWRTLRGSVFEGPPGSMLGDSFSGLQGFSLQDFVMMGAAGPLYDRRKEHLGSSDIAVIRMRRLLLDSARQVESGGEPLGLQHPVDYASIVAPEATIPLGQRWQDLVGNHVVVNR